MRTKAPDSVAWSWILLTASAPAVWGTTYVVTTTMLPEASPLWSSVLRALPAGLIGFLFCRRLPHGEWIWKSCVLGLLNMGIFFPLLFISAYRLPGGIASVLSACQPLFTAILAWLVLRESPRVWRIFWGIVGVVGIALMVLDPHATLDLGGIIAGVLGTASMATGIVLTKRWGRPEGVGGFTWTTWLLTWSGVLLVPAAFAFEGLPPALDLPALTGYAWLSLVGGLLAYWAWFTGLAKLSAGSASFLPLLSPIVATLLGIVVLHELLGTVQWVGFALCLSAIFLAQKSPGHRNRSVVLEAAPQPSLKEGN